MVAPDPRPKGGDPADVNRVAHVSDSQGREALERRLGALEQQVSALSAELARSALEERALCLATIEAARDDLFAGLDELAGEVDGLVESRDEPSAGSRDVMSEPGAFSRHLESAEAHLERGALSAGAKVVFDRMGLDQSERTAVEDAARAYFDRRIDELRTMNSTFIRSQGRPSETQSLARLEASDGQLLADLRDHLSDEQVQALLPMIRSVVSTPAYLSSAGP